MQYIVTTVIQSANIDDNEPVEVQWYSGPSLALAVAAMAQAATHNEHDSDLPESVRPRTLSVRLDMEEPERASASTDERRISARWDEEGEYALSDCAWWDTTRQYQDWARRDCSGRMVRVTWFGSDAVLCEGHYNAYPGD